MIAISISASTLSRRAQAQSPRAAVPTAANDAEWRHSVLAWRERREREIAAPDGWLTLAGLDWLKPGVNSVGAAADCQIRLHGNGPAHVGLLTVSGKAPNNQIVQLLSPPGGFPDGLTIDGGPAREGPLSVEGATPSTIGWHGLRMVVLDRGGRFALRVKDADSAARTAFRSLHWYEPDPRLRVVAQWTPFKPPIVEKIPTVLGTTLDLPSPGFASFTLDGKPLRLQPVTEAGDLDKLFFILSDETSKNATFEGGRYLHTGFPDHGLDLPGYLVLDFNELYNPPCAYTPYATCPLPPEQNRLPVAILAGEQRYMQ
jgi:uncharacterized protein